MKWLIPVVMLAVGCSKPPPPPPIIKPVFFEVGSVEFAHPADDKAVVERAANILDTTEFSVVCVGLADTSGDAASNKVLAQQRAEHVADMVKAASKAGAKRIHSYALGESLATNDTQGERKVEFVFYRDSGQPIAQVVEHARTLADDRSDKAKAGNDKKKKK